MPDDEYGVYDERRIPQDNADYLGESANPWSDRVED